MELIPGKWTFGGPTAYRKEWAMGVDSAEAKVRCQFTNPADGKMDSWVEAPTNRLPNVLSWDG